MVKSTAQTAAAIMARYEPDQPSSNGSHKPPQRDLIVDLALDRYTFGVSLEGDAFAVEQGSHIAIPLKTSARSLKAKLARAYREEHGTVPSASALTDAITALEGYSFDAEPVALHLRVAMLDGTVYVDMGDGDHGVIAITADGWDVVESAPMMFRRTAATNPMPEPVRGGTLSTLWRVANVRERDRDLTVAILAAGFIPDIPHVILAFMGEQGTGKSEALRMFVNLLDPSPAPTRTAPENIRDWVVAASASWVVGIDNVSWIPDWLSDALCRASTGDGMVRRALYSDGDLAIDAFQRVVFLDGIDFGALRGDFLDRLVVSELDRIDKTDRLPLRSIGGREGIRDVMEREHPLMLGALLDVVVDMLAGMNEVDPAELPRMADAAVVFAAMDHIRGTDSLSRFNVMVDENLARAVESDVVASKVLTFAVAKGERGWSGTATELLDAVTPDPLPKRFPTTAAVMGGRLRRAAPGLRQLGVDISFDRESGTKTAGSRTRLIHIRYDAGEMPEPMLPDPM